MRAFLFHEQRVVPGLAPDHAAQNARQPVGVEMILQKMVLRAALRGLPGDAFIVTVGDDQDRNQCRDGEERFERLDAAAVGQEQIEQHRGGFPALQMIDAVGEPPDAFHAPRILAPLRQRLLDKAGIGVVVRDQ